MFSGIWIYKMSLNRCGSCLLALVVLLLLCVQRSEGWFEYCDHSVPLTANRSIYINSPYYPNRYPSGSSCRYTVVAPADYEINIQCNIDLDKYGADCTTEFFYVAIDGDPNVRGSEYFCGVGYIQRKSLFNRLVLAYTSSGSVSSGRFSCFITTNPKPCDCGWSAATRITGGVEARINEFPFMTAIYNVPSKRVFCSGMLISHWHVLSAAHCFTGAYGDRSQMLLILGEHDLKTESESPYTQRHPVAYIKIHENYDQRTSFNDIAILTSSTEIFYSRGVGPICLPLLYSFANFENRQATIAGWGATSFAGTGSTVLRKARVTIVPNSRCQGEMGSLRESQLCTYGPPSDACQNDSGGPVIVTLNRSFAAGIISYGYACGIDAPAINTRVTSYLDWIQANTRTDFCRRN